MAISDIFRPRHRHSDAKVRADAVRVLGPEDLEVLAEVAREDEDPGVRAAAIDRIGDPSLLAELAANDPLESLRARAGERAAELWVARALAAADGPAGPEAIAELRALGAERGLVELARRGESATLRAAALAAVTDPKALAEIARAAPDAETRAAALERVDDPEALRAIAIDETRKSVGLAALERIEDPALLEAVAARAKHRAVRTRAARRVSERARAESRGGPSPVAAADPARRARAERAQLCREVEALAGGNEWIESRRRIDEAGAAWAALGEVGLDRELGERFERARRRYRSRYEKYGQRTAEVIAERRAAAGAAAPAGEETSADAAQPAGEEASAGAAPGEDGDRRRSRAAAPGADGDRSRSRAAAPGAALDDLRDQEEGDEAAAAREPAASASREDNLAKLEAIVRRLEELASTADKVRTGERWLARADQEVRRLGPFPPGKRRPAMEAFAEARRKLVIRVGELREVDEWKRWASVPRQEELIARVTALAEAEEGDQDLGAELKRAQAEWKEVGPAPPDRAQDLWNRFKEASDRVYARVVEQRKHQTEEQKENLRLKEELCARAEELAESTDWSAAAEELKRLQGEWKRIGPVPRRQSDKIWKRFRGACDRFFERRRPHVEQRIAELVGNLERKQAILAEIEALAAEEGDLEEAEQRVGDLRRRFRDIGPVPQKELGPLMERFREACDQVSRRRREREELARAGARAELDAARAALADALAAEPAEAAPVAEATLALRGRLRELAELSRRDAELEALRREVDDLCARAVEAHPRAFKGSELDPAVSRRRKEKLLARVLELCPEREAPSAPATAEEMAARLRAALADRALGGVLSRTGGRSPEEVVREARESWRRLGPVPGPEGAALEERFEDACQRAAPGPSSQTG